MIYGTLNIVVNYMIILQLPANWLHYVHIMSYTLWQLVLFVQRLNIV